MADLTIQDVLSLALQHHQAGRLTQAEMLYRQVLVRQPSHVDAMHNLGMIAQQAGRLEVAAELFRQVISLRPACAEAHSNLGSVLTEKDEIDEAIAACRQAIAFKPEYASAYYNLGNALRAKGQLDEAIIAYRQAVARRPAYPEALNNLANALRVKGQLDQAITACRQAIALNPNLAAAYLNLGSALGSQGKIDQAIVALRHAISLRPSTAEAHNNLGNALSAVVQPGQAIAAYRQALAVDPDNAGIGSNLILRMHYDPASDASAIAQEQRRWDRAHVAPLQRLIESPRNDRNPDRLLRVGYVSSDLREHPVGQSLVPLFLHRSRQDFHVTCYAQVARPDAITARLRENSERWRDIAGLSDDQVAKQVREDGIDLLVDLALHTSHNRLLLFARKPAPVQVTFAGYPGSTGMSTIDYRLSDPNLDPPGMDESIYSEHTLRLPDSFWCYDPLECGEIPVNALPALESGVVTFGCLNSFHKTNDDLLGLWAQVLRRVGNSRLLLLAPPGSHREGTAERLRRDGFDSGNVQFVQHQPRRQYLQEYHRVDIGLDTFPYNGHMTSLDSFWMGVPVVTLVGTRAVSRGGWSQLSNLRLTELAARTPEQFVHVAAELASDLPRLNELRSTLRQRMEQSPLMDAPKFARNIEAAYRQMWRNWCAKT